MFYIGSDWHLGHHRIISHDTDRSHFSSIEEHDELILSNFEKTVQKSDTFFFLGDMCLSRDRTYLPRILARMKNACDNLMFIKGNHDHSDSIKLFKMYNYLGLKYELKINDITITLDHYPCRSWNKSHHGHWLLHGHEHGGAEEWGKSIDVCVNKHNFKPWSFSEIELEMSKRPIKYLGHHTSER